MATRPGAASAPASPRATMQPEQLVHDAEAMCRYPSKKCWNPRALKRNGERHNLCNLHRQKANKNQRRLELKRKARAQDAEPADKRLRTHKKPRQRARRAPLSAHLAMKEEARARQAEQEAAGRASTAAAAGFTSWFLQDLVLLDGVYERSGLHVKEEPASLLPTPSIELQGDSGEEEALDRMLQDGQGDALCRSLGTTSGLEALAALPEGKTSPVDVGESWDSLDFSDYWLTPADQPAVSFDASAFVVEEDVFVADV